MTKRIFDVLVPLALDHAYSYRAPDSIALAPGDLVTVPLGPRDYAGVVWAEPDTPDRRIDSSWICNSAACVTPGSPERSISMMPFSSRHPNSEGSESAAQTSDPSSRPVSSHRGVPPSGRRQR